MLDVLLHILSCDYSGHVTTKAPTLEAVLTVSTLHVTRINKYHDCHFYGNSKMNGKKRKDRVITQN